MVEFIIFLFFLINNVFKKVASDSDANEAKSNANEFLTLIKNKNTFN